MGVAALNGFAFLYGGIVHQPSKDPEDGNPRYF